MPGSHSSCPAFFVFEHKLRSSDPSDGLTAPVTCKPVFQDIIAVAAGYFRLIAERAKVQFFALTPFSFTLYFIPLLIRS
jgi:hypothetical protein